jgi:hypothetical protein
VATILTPAQRRLLRIVLGLALFVLANSAYLFLAGRGAELTVFYQLMLLGHLAGGAVLLVLATTFLVWHLGRVKKLLRAAAVSSGAALTLVAYLLFASGLFIIYEASSRENQWIFLSHRVLALLAPAAYGVHRLVSHFRPARRTMVRGALAFTTLTAVFWGVHLLSLPDRPAPRAQVAAKTDPFIPFLPKNYPDATSPFFPAATTTDSGNYFPARIITRGERKNQERIQADVDRLGFAANTTIGAETCRRCVMDVGDIDGGERRTEPRELMAVRGVVVRQQRGDRGADIAGRDHRLHA